MTTEHLDQSYWVTILGYLEDGTCIELCKRQPMKREVLNSIEIELPELNQAIGCVRASLAAFPAERATVPAIERPCPIESLADPIKFRLFP